VFDSPSERRALEILNKLSQAERRRPSASKKQTKQKTKAMPDNFPKSSDNQYDLLSKITILENDLMELKERLEVIQISIDALSASQENQNKGLADDILSLTMEKEAVLNDLERLEVEYVTARSKISAM